MPNWYKALLIQMGVLAGVAFWWFLTIDPIQSVLYVVWVGSEMRATWFRYLKGRAVEGSLERAAAATRWKRWKLTGIAAGAGGAVAASVNSPTYLVTWAVVILAGVITYRNDKDGGNPFKGLGKKVRNWVTNKLTWALPQPSPA